MFFGEKLVRCRVHFVSSAPYISDRERAARQVTSQAFGARLQLATFDLRPSGGSCNLSFVAFVCFSGSFAVASKHDPRITQNKKRNHTKYNVSLDLK
jgi:hypothetical protein